MIFGIKQKDDFDLLFEALRTSKIQIPNWQSETFDIKQLINYDNLFTVNKKKSEVTSIV